MEGRDFLSKVFITSVASVLLPGVLSTSKTNCRLGEPAFFLNLDLFKVIFTFYHGQSTPTPPKKKRLALLPTHQPGSLLHRHVVLFFKYRDAHEEENTRGWLPGLHPGHSWLLLPWISLSGKTCEIQLLTWKTWIQKDGYIQYTKKGELRQGRLLSIIRVCCGTCPRKWIKILHLRWAKLCNWGYPLWN